MPQVGAGTERMTTVLRIAATFWSAWSLGSAGGWWIRTLGNCALGLAGDGNCALLKVCAPSLEAVKARLDRALGSLIGWLAILPWQGGGTGWSLRSPATWAILWQIHIHQPFPTACNPPYHLSGRNQSQLNIAWVWSDCPLLQHDRRSGCSEKGLRKWVSCNINAATSMCRGSAEIHALFFSTGIQPPAFAKALFLFCLHLMLSRLSTFQKWMSFSNG